MTARRTANRAARFDFTVPDVGYGDRVTLDVSVETRPGPQWHQFRRVVRVHGRGMSALRRLGKAG